jgi:hypothetical protein
MPFYTFADADADADLVLPHDKKFPPAANLTDDDARLRESLRFE